MTVSAPAKAAEIGSGSSHPVRVMIVDDALVARGFVKRWVDAEPDLELVASLRDGREAIDRIESVNPDVIVLDIEMPDVDGLTALPLLLQKKPNVAIIMASTLTRRNAEISLKALALGALDCIPKPDGNTRDASREYRDELINKIRALGRRSLGGGPRGPNARAGAPAAVPRPARWPQAVHAPNLASSLAPAAAPARTAAVRMRPFPKTQPKALLIGSSTGGPQALHVVVPGLAPVIDRVPVLITQHMPPTFTTILAEHLARASGMPVREAVHGEPVVPGRVYLAPGGLHMRVARGDGHPVIALDDGPHVHFCKPAVDPLFQSAADLWGGQVFAVILTGMGSDGSSGAQRIVAAGGAVIAQDEATSVVWGMPGSAAEAGLCSAIVPLDGMAGKIVRYFSGERP